MFCCLIARNNVAGSIPASFCGSDGITIDVSSTDIVCYSGCLTSAAVLVTGASGQCHDGSIMREFVTVLCAVLLTGIGFTCALRVSTDKRCTKLGPTNMCRVQSTNDSTTPLSRYGVVLLILYYASQYHVVLLSYYGNIGANIAWRRRVQWL